MIDHIIGICHDHHLHPDLLDLLMYGGGITGIWVYIKWKGKETWQWFKSLFKREE